MNKRCGKQDKHQGHWVGKLWCDGKTNPVQHDGS